MMFVKLLAKESTVHGLGCFATKALKRGMVLAFWGDTREVRLLNASRHKKKFQKRAAVTIQTGVRLMGDWFVESIRIADKDPSDYINHSDRPNVGYVGGVLFTLRNIKAGEELFVDYRLFNAQFETNVVKGYGPLRQLKASAAQMKKAFGHSR